MGIEYSRAEVVAEAARLRSRRRNGALYSIVNATLFMIMFGALTQRSAFSGQPLRLIWGGFGTLAVGALLMIVNAHLVLRPSGGTDPLRIGHGTKSKTVDSFTPGEMAEAAQRVLSRKRRWLMFWAACFAAWGAAFGAHITALIRYYPSTANLAPDGFVSRFIGYWCAAAAIWFLLESRRQVQTPADPLGVLT